MIHFYHVYAAGNWEQPVTEHCDALVRYGLYDELASLQVGFVGAPDQIAAARATLDALVPRYEVCAESPEGWEQVTLHPLYQFVQDHDGPVSYAHTKGASRSEPIDTPWRRMMEYRNFVDWRRPVDAVECGGVIAGCYWLAGATPTGDGVRWVNGIPSGGIGAGGIFGGNFWWATGHLLRRNVPPSDESRHAAEHWLGQLIPIAGAKVCELQPFPIGEYPPEWWRL